MYLRALIFGALQRDLKVVGLEIGDGDNEGLDPMIPHYSINIVQRPQHR